MPSRYKLSWTGTALEDLRELRAYIARDKPIAAKKMAERIRAQAHRLREFPESGRIVPELETLGLREIIVPPFRVVYLVVDRRVVALRVWHSKRSLGPRALPPNR